MIYYSDTMKQSMDTLRPGSMSSGGLGGLPSVHVNPLGFSSVNISLPCQLGSLHTETPVVSSHIFLKSPHLDPH